MPEKPQPPVNLEGGTSLLEAAGYVAVGAIGLYAAGVWVFPWLADLFQTLVGVARLPQTLPAFQKIRNAEKAVGKARAVLERAKEKLTVADKVQNLAKDFPTAARSRWMSRYEAMTRSACTLKEEATGLLCPGNQRHQGGQQQGGGGQRRQGVPGVDYPPDDLPREQRGDWWRAHPQAAERDRQRRQQGQQGGVLQRGGMGPTGARELTI